MRLKSLPWIVGLAVVCAGFGARPSAAGPLDKSRPSATRTAKARKVPARKKKQRSRNRRERAQRAPTTERIREIQSALAREGSYAAEPTGRWDAATIEAMKKFQVSQGLNPTGRIDALSLQKLGLGSQVAGIASPIPSGQHTPSTPVRPN